MRGEGSRRALVEVFPVSLHLERHDLTYEDYGALPNDGQRYEIVDGRLYVSPSPQVWHQVLSGRLYAWLHCLQDVGQGFVFSAPTDLVMPGCTPVQPDLIFLDASQAECLKQRFIEGVPLLLVEILSPSTAGYDRVTKLNRYARSGVPHYWIVDGEMQTVEVLELSDGCYRIVFALTREDTLVFRELNLALGALFAPIPGAFKD